MQANFHIMNREILRLAIPNIISNITIPLLGMADVAIAGHAGSDADIGAIGVGTTIFNLIYWNCAFLRMGTSGITAQAFGAKNHNECADILIRSVFVSVLIAALLLFLQRPIGRLSLRLMQCSETVHRLAAEYFFARIWAAPASVSLFAIQGWFIGMQDSKSPMLVAILSNIVNIIFSVLFVFHFDMGIAGVAWGTVVAQYTGLVASWIIWAIKYGEYARYADWRRSMRIAPLLRFFHINKDVFLRTACIVAAYTFFTSASSRFGDTILATNTLLMNLFTLFSYMSDGMAYAAESLSGRFVGERNPQALKKCIRLLILWSGGIAALYVGVYVAAWRPILSLFGPSADIIACAGHYMGWVISVPLIAFPPFLMDGIMLGATQTKILRNTVFIATLLYFALFYLFKNTLGNNALWIAFIVFVASRGILLYFASDKLNVQKLIGIEKDGI